MVRLASDPVDKPMSMTWDGTLDAARKIADWSRDSAGNLRFGYIPGLNTPDQARVYVARPFPDSPSWERAPVGSTISRLDVSEDAPLSLTLPPEAKPRDPYDILKESA